MIEDQLFQFEAQGFLHVPGVVSGAMLTRLQAAFEAAAHRYADQWPASSALPYFDIPQPLDQDDVFVDLADIPTLFPLLLAILGADIQLVQTQARLLRPGPSHTPDWHSDLAGIRGINLGQTVNFHLKAHFYPWDLAPDQGCLAFLPGTHRFADGAERPEMSQESDSPIVRKIVPKAGDAVLFNTHLLHMALDNRNQQVRRSIIYSYSHFWVKGAVSGVPKDLERLATTPQRRQLFQQPAGHAEPPFFMNAYEADHRHGMRGLLKAGSKLLRRTLGTHVSKH
jgi:hypothetical protein